MKGMPNPQPLARERFFLNDEIATQQLAHQLAQGLCHQRVQQFAQRVQGHSETAIQSLRFDLSGDLGAGKTTFVRALLRHLGYQGRVKSPTYTLCEPYDFVCDASLMTSCVSEENRTFQVYHFDLYRLSEMSEWEDAGFRDYLDSGALCLVEWPERVHLNPPDLKLAFSVQEMARDLCIEAYTVAGKALLDDVQFLSHVHGK